ncbi:NAD(P)-binding protein [Ceratobasidium sp. AG-I]|nr:NAD(P)-binding protein [Ceratobasidium sp. AG-I]
MPYSENAHSRPVASALAGLSIASAQIDNFLASLYPKMSVPHTDLHGKVAIVTGANSGIGFEAARLLVGMGAYVVLACRSESRGEEAKRKILELTGSTSVEVGVLDCGSFKSVRAFVDRWQKRESNQVDILINNAGCLTSTVAISEDGFELTYQANHLSHVLLTHLLLNRGHFAPNARIVSVASAGLYGSIPLDEHNVDSKDVLARYNNKQGTPISLQDSFQFYTRSKAAQVVWTIALQRRLSQTEGWKTISAHSCHPGTVNTPIWTQPAGAGSWTGTLASVISSMGRILGVSSEQGAVVPVWLAIAPKPAKPQFRGMFWDRKHWKWVNPWCLESERQDRLWNKWCEDTNAPLA